jgi:hypothetical protein
MDLPNSPSGLAVILPEPSDFEMVKILRAGDVVEELGVMPLPFKKWLKGLRYIAVLSPLFGFASESKSFTEAADFDSNREAISQALESDLARPFIHEFLAFATDKPASFFEAEEVNRQSLDIVMAVVKANLPFFRGEPLLSNRGRRGKHKRSNSRTEKTTITDPNPYAYTIDVLLSHGHTREDVWDMNIYQLRAYTEAAERWDAEKAIRLMNVASLAFNGTQQGRQDFINQLLGVENRLDTEGFDALFGISANSDASDPATDELRRWALAGFEKDKSGYLN